VRFTFDTIESNVGDVSAWMWWADLLSRAERELLVLEANFRRSRSQALAKMLERDPKLAEWKAHAFVDESQNALDARCAIAEAHRNVVLLREVVAALRPTGREPMQRHT